MNAAVRIGRISPGDAGEVLTVQLAAYVVEAQRYAEPHLPPLTETLAEIRSSLGSVEVVGFGAWLGHRLVGSVRGLPGGGRMEVARFSVAPDMQRTGIGGRLLTMVEQAVPQDIDTLWLITGARSEDNLRLYRRVGYQAVGTRVDRLGIELVLLEKAVPRRVGRSPCPPTGSLHDRTGVRRWSGGG